jgi:serine/threonine-protein kinase
VPKAAAGAAAPTVNVTVAQEPTVAVPGTTGQDPTAAAALLGQAGFQVTTAPTPSDTIPTGQVIGTFPPAGTQLPKGTSVALLVSTGPQLVDVPNVVGQTKAAAENALNVVAGFGVQETFVNAGPSQTGLVVSQNPAGGQLAKGSTVAITIGS